MILLLIIPILIFVLPFILCIFDRIFKTCYSCQYFGWHDGKGRVKICDGINTKSVCSKCNSNVMQDSQGNWFDY